MICSPRETQPPSHCRRILQQRNQETHSFSGTFQYHSSLTNERMANLQRLARCRFLIRLHGTPNAPEPQLASSAAEGDGYRSHGKYENNRRQPMSYLPGILQIPKQQGRVLASQVWASVSRRLYPSQSGTQHHLSYLHKVDWNNPTRTHAIGHTGGKKASRCQLRWVQPGRSPRDDVYYEWRYSEGLPRKPRALLRGDNPQGMVTGQRRGS